MQLYIKGCLVKRTIHLIQREKTGHVTRTSFQLLFKSNLMCKVSRPLTFSMIYVIKCWLDSLNREKKHISDPNEMLIEYFLTNDIINLPATSLETHF